VLQPQDIIRLEDEAVVVLDQTRLPAERVERRCTTVPELIDAIRVLAVRGAPALGVAGAMGVALAARTAPDHPVGMRQYLAEQGALLAAARPTAVNLAWGVQQALAELDREVRSPQEARGRIAARARRIQDDEVARCRAMGAHGAALFGDRAELMTQCNTGGLATGGYGTALGVVFALAEDGGDPHVYVPETRPLLQGARLTAYELAEAGVRHTLVTDNATGAILREGAVAGILVGADRIAANGDTANKIGTYNLAVLARHHDVPFYVVAPSSTIDPATPSGAAIPIEQRSGAEVTGFGGVVTAPPATTARNDAFDVTPAELVTAIVTEHGVRRPPYDLRGERPDG
jgi:methylthioribose-1-phosphate isomerase